MNRDQFKAELESLEGHYVTPDQLCIGLYIHLDLGWMQHPFAFSHFRIKDAEQLRKIHALNLKQIRYDPARSDVEPRFSRTVPTQPPAPAPEAVPPASAASPTPAPKFHAGRVARLKALTTARAEAEKAYSTHSTLVREAVRGLAHHPEHAREAAERLVTAWVESTITESDVALYAISPDQPGQEAYVHSFNVTVLSLMLAKTLDMREDEATLAGMAALFHDAGKEEAPRNKSFMDMHCALGAAAAERAGLPKRVSRIIMEHHEYMDGTGYPMRLREDRIDPLARLVGLVNHFDNLCNPLNPSEAMTPYEALAVMYATQQSKFDATILRAFVRCLGVYPPGSIVQLSNGVYAMVLTANPQKPMLPMVMIHAPRVARETPVVIDLAEEQDLTIKKCLRPEHLPRPAFDYLRPRKSVSYYFMKHGMANQPDPALNTTQREAA